MESMILPILAMLAFFIYCIASLLKESKRLRRHALMVRKLYESTLFEDLMPILLKAKKRHIVQVTIDKTGLLFTYLTPAGSHLAFMMKKHGYAYLTTEQQLAMETVLEECLPKLKDSKKYRRSCRKIHLVNGDVDYVYRYTMQNGYKTMLNRAPYYDPRRHPETADFTVTGG